MGGDLGPRAIIPAVIEALREQDELSIQLVGQSDQLSTILPENLDPSISRRLHIVHAADVVAMTDQPSAVLRSPADTSMKQALKLLAEKRVQAVVSAGNTGALMALGRQTVGMLEGILRPAVCTMLPSYPEPSYLLDLGANTDCQPQHLQQFAVMGSALVKALGGAERPRVALLNIGTEAGKGNELVKATAELLAADQHVHYIGFVEADHLLDSDIDVIVCDGFSGNIALKSSEGTAAFIADRVKAAASELEENVAKTVLGTLWQNIAPQNHNGAFFSV